MKIIAIDYGDSRTGIAISDPLGFMAGRSFVIFEKFLPKLVEKIIEVINTEKPTEIVLGYPKNMDNTIGVRGKLSVELKEILEEKTNLPVILWDERTTTVQAHNILRDTGKKRIKHKDKVDAVAASLILENYLSFKKR